MKTCTQGNWSVSTTSGGDLKGFRLNVTRFFDGYKMRDGDYDGRIFPSREAVDAFALEHGYTERYYRRRSVLISTFAHMSGHRLEARFDAYYRLLAWKRRKGIAVSRAEAARLTAMAAKVGIFHPCAPEVLEPGKRQREIEQWRKRK